MRIEMDENSEDYKRIVHHDGVRTTMCRNKFEIIAVPGGEIWEQQAVQMLRDWVRWRKAQEDV